MRTLLLPILTLILAPGTPDEFVAVKAGKIYTVSGAVIDNGVILIKNGKIVEVGTSVKIPDGAKIIDASGDTVIPGLVNPYSAAGLVTPGAGEPAKDENEGKSDEETKGDYVEPRPKDLCPGENPPKPRDTEAPFPSFRAFGGGGGSNIDFMAYDLLDPLDERFVSLQRAGYTTVGIYPTQGTFSGRMLAVKTWPGPRDTMALARDKVERMRFQASTAAKEEIRKTFDAAKQFIEAEKKAEEEKKKKEDAAKKGPPKPPEGGGPPPTPAPAPPQAPPGPPGPPPEKPKEPNDKEKVAISILKGETTLFVEIANAASVLHFWQVIDSYKDFPLKIVYVVPGDVYRLTAKLGERKAQAVAAPGVVFDDAPYTRDRISISKELQKAGVAFAFTPISDAVASHEAVLAHAAESVKFGVTRENALKALTLLPAQFLGVADRVGSIEPNRDGDLVVLSGDPFAATTRLKKVLIEGNIVFEEK